MLKNKKILITTGPTWVPIDDVRVISNISSGELGILLAKKASESGLKVDLFLGPIGEVSLKKDIRIFRFSYFNELLGLIHKHLVVKKYDIIIHCAAVSDYFVNPIKGKISSDKDSIVLQLSRAPKIIEIIRHLNPKASLVMFKLESGVSDKVLLSRAIAGMKKYNADLVVANTVSGQKYKGYILDAKKVISKCVTKRQLAEQLFRVLA